MVEYSNGLLLPDSSTMPSTDPDCANENCDIKMNTVDMTTVFMKKICIKIVLILKGSCKSICFRFNHLAWLDLSMDLFTIKKRA